MKGTNKQMKGEEGRRERKKRPSSVDQGMTPQYERHAPEDKRVRKEERMRRHANMQQWR